MSVSSGAYIKNIIDRNGDIVYPQTKTEAVYGIVPVEKGGVPKTSIGGTEWTQSNITSGGFKCVYYDNGIWVAGSNNGNGLYYSTDGMIWTQSNITSGYFEVYYGNGIWVAASSSNGLYYSTDGMTWTQSNITSGDFRCVYNNNGIWVTGNYNNKGLYYSTDGMTWTQSNITSGGFYSVYYDNSIWVAGSAGSNKGLYYSKSDIGKMLMVDNLGNPVWTTIINAEEVAY